MSLGIWLSLGCIERHPAAEGEIIVVDMATVDAEARDSRPVDAAVTDAAITDATRDATSQDAQAADMATPRDMLPAIADAGLPPDAGPPPCDPAVTQCDCAGDACRIVKISMAEEHACALLRGGGVKCWGRDLLSSSSAPEYLGDAPDEMGDNLPFIGLDRFAEDLRVAYDHGCALLDDGDVVCWGRHACFQADGLSSNAVPPGRCDFGGQSARRLVGSNRMLCAVLNNGNLACWGAFRPSALRTSEQVEINFGATGVIDLLHYRDEFGTWVLFEDGRLVRGRVDRVPHRNPRGRLEVGFSADAQGFNNVAEFTQPGLSGFGVQPAFVRSTLGRVGYMSPLTGTINWLFEGVHRFATTSPLAIVRDGQIIHSHARLAADEEDVIDIGEVSPIASLTGAADAVCAVFEDGRAKCWGSNHSATPAAGDRLTTISRHDEIPSVDLGPGRTAIALAGDGSTVCAVLDTNQVRCWGDNLADAILGDDPEETGEGLHTIAFDDEAQISRVRLAQGNGQWSAIGVAVALDGRLRIWGRFGRGPIAPANAVSVAIPGAPIVDLDVNSDHACLLQADGLVRCWGQNSQGQLGLDHHQNVGTDPRQFPDELPAVPLPEAAAQVSVGVGRSCALTVSGAVYCWGRWSRPVQREENVVRFDLDEVATSVTLDGSRRCVTYESGEAECWPRLQHPIAQSGLPRPITRMFRHQCLTANGGLWCRGTKLDVGEGNVVDLVGGLNHTCALLESGQVKCWGTNEFGGLGAGGQSFVGDRADELGDNLPYLDLGGN